MRIISGINKGMKLYAPDGIKVRPTSDKIKEAVFNMIGNIEGSALDLFTGSGSIGIEFLARGAKECYFVDSSRKSLAFVRKNLEVCSFINKSRIIQSDYEKAIVNLSNENIRFDYIFADPPYDLKCGSNIIHKIFTKGILKTNGLLVIESDKSEELVYNIDMNILKCKEKIYGRTKINIFKHLEE